MSDSLLMEGVKVGCANEGELALKALHAGIDILLDVADPVGTLNALEQAAAAGKLSNARVDEALGRVLKLKAAAFNAQPSTGFNETENRRQTEAMALDVARRATVVPKQTGGLLPFAPERSLCAVLVNPFPLPSNAEPPPLGKMLADKFPRLNYVELGAEPSDAELARVAELAATADQLLAAFVVKPAAWHRFGLPPRLRDWLQGLVARRPTVIACLGAPQGLDPLAEAPVQICTYSDVPVSQAALVERLLKD